MRWIHALPLLAFGLLLIGFGVWRYWACFFGSDEMLWFKTKTPPLADMLALEEAHKQQVKKLDTAKAPLKEYTAELREHQEAKAYLQRQHTANISANAPRRRWFEFGSATAALMGSFMCFADGYRRLKKTPA